MSFLSRIDAKHLSWACCCSIDPGFGASRSYQGGISGWNEININTHRVEINSRRVIKVSCSNSRLDISVCQQFSLRDSAEFVLCWVFSHCIDFKQQSIVCGMCSLNIDNLETRRQTSRVVGRKRLQLGSWVLSFWIWTIYPEQTVIGIAAGCCCVAHPAGFQRSSWEGS